VAKALGVSHSWVWRIEQGESTNASLLDLARALAVVGLELSVRAYPAGSPLRDTAHARLLERLRHRLGTGVSWRTEVPLPNPGDLRSWDAVVSLAEIRIGVEAETRVRDGQELERRLALKRRDGGVDRVILLLGDTRANRAFVVERAGSLKAGFPVEGRAALAALRRGLDPGGDAIVLV
jgi:transcriptional regulator with XRE-family HTH domain